MGRRFDNIQTKLLHRRLREWHNASCPRFFENLVLLDLPEFSDRQLVQVLVGGTLLASLQDAPCHPRFVHVPDRMFYQIP